MKNLFVLPTDKPSRLLQSLKVIELLDKEWLSPIGNINRNTYITSDEEIKEGDWFLCLDNGKCNDSIYKANEAWLNMEEKQPSYCKKVILTDNKDLIKDGVQDINDEFLKWFVNNPSCEVVEVVKTAPIRPFGSLYKIIIPKEEAKKKHIVMLVGDKVNEEQTKCYCGHTTTCDCGPEETKQECMITKSMQMDAKMAYDSLPKQDKIMERFIANAKQESLEEFIEKEGYPKGVTQEIWEQGVREGAKWQQERSYSEEDMAESFMACWKANVPEGFECKLSFNEWFEQFKKK